ncbi:MAG TPA: 3-oxoacyl-[acyl-carrier-protein] reductase [Parachlamydiales bacterium]|nr:3-oxoacyl-[acyl-carrier-protein] reductase [Parachlamydiales bacterium]
MKELLKDKRALITGGTSGIGKQIALTYARQGAHIAIFSMEEGSSILQELQTLSSCPEQKFWAKIVDVSDGAAVEQGVEELLAAFGRVDILVNNAGITRDNLLMKLSEQDWDLVLSVNLKSVYNMCRQLIRPMLKSKRGKIINTASVIGLTGNAGQSNYAASKAGMIGFTKSLAQEVASRGICVNCIAPGFIRTRMTDKLSDSQKETISEKIPMRRLGEPQDVANVALFLASDLSNYMTGQVLTVDGGMVMS